MRYENGKVLDLKIAYVGGGSRGWAWGFMTDLTGDGQMEVLQALINTALADDKG